MTATLLIILLSGQVQHVEGLEIYQCMSYQRTLKVKLEGKYADIQCMLVPDAPDPNTAADTELQLYLLRHL